MFLVHLNYLQEQNDIHIVSLINTLKGINMYKKFAQNM